MKKILLLFDRLAVEQKLADPDKLVSLMEKTDADVSVTAACWEDLVFYVSKESASIIIRSSGIDIVDFDVVYFRRAQLNVDLRLAAAIYLHKKSVPFIDQEAYQPAGSVNKLTQYFRSWENNLPIPATFYGLTENDVDLLVKRNLTYPLVVKSLAGTRGEDNHLVQREEDLVSLIKNYEARYLVQQFIPNDCDYRVLVFGDSPKMVIKRTRTKDTHKNNTSQGAHAEVVEGEVFSNDAKEDIVKAARCIGRNVAGVDIVIDKDTGKHYFFEVNRAPQIENSTFELKKAEYLVDYLKDISR